jgi:acyl-CoA hydrolase
MQKLANIVDILPLLKGHQGVFVQGASSTPEPLLDVLAKNADQCDPLTFYHLHIHGDAPHADVEKFRVVNFFVGKNIRKKLDYDRVDYLPCFLSEIPKLLESGDLSFDVSLIHVSPPDEHGYCSLGLSVDIVPAALKHSKLVIALVNKNMPRTFGDGVIHQSQIDYGVFQDFKITEIKSDIISPVEAMIGANVATLIPDGATLQLGIGGISDAVLSSLHSHKDLGIHTEMFTNSLIPLLESGVVNNSKKNIHPYKVITGFAVGDNRLMEYVHNNPAINFLNIAYVNHPNVIKRNPKVMAINSAVEVDLTGQVCADSIGSNIISGVGGQLDFMRGAIMCPGGKAIIALPSRTHRGESRICTTLKPGAGVVTTRQHVQYVVTEYGVASLSGKTLNERAQALIKISHPEDRPRLMQELRVLRSL